MYYKFNLLNMSYNDEDNKEIKIGEEDGDDADFLDDPNDPLIDSLEEEDLIGTDDDLFDSEFTGSDDSEY